MQNVSIPIAVLIWLMIYPMMLKVDFQSIKDVGKNPKGLFVTWVTNWLIKPFTMFGIAWFFFYVIFKGLISPELGARLSCRCRATWGSPMYGHGFCMELPLKGNAAYTVVQVASNDLIILVAFTPIVAFLLVLEEFPFPGPTLILSVVLFVVIPLVGGILTRNIITKRKGREYFQNKFIPKFGNITTLGLLLTLILIFPFKEMSYSKILCTSF